MELSQFISYLQNDKEFMARITQWQVRESVSGNFFPMPESLHPDLAEVLAKRGLSRLYSHQKEAWQVIADGKNPILVTPTASGKTLAYLLPVLDALLKNRNLRALFLFPTKALAQDQWTLLEDLNRIGSLKIQTFTYDGDTPANVRKKIREAGQIVISNPDMLHAGILPNHASWIQLFENLAFVVVDELHIYRGVFGSHLANLMRRLKRVLNFYHNQRIKFILTSATIANPLEHAASITGLRTQDLVLIDKNGSPQGEKHFLFYNPPLVQAELGIRKSALKEAAWIGEKLLLADIPSIFFVRSRVRVEVLASYLKRQSRAKQNGIRAYRGGYLPSERRAIEKGLRSGQIHTVVSTNALELGVDIGSLDAAISVGFPGTIASVWQQFGRAGRRDKTSLAILIAGSSPLEQYYVNQPGAFFGSPVERALINPDNYLIEMAHLRAAAFEIPLNANESFGSLDILAIGRYLAKEGIIKEEKERFYWSSAFFPANEISLRSASQENFVIVDTTENNRLIGEVDFYAAPTLIHEGAMYMHQDQTYYIEQLDWNKRMAFAKKSRPDYFTDAEEKVEFQILTIQQDLSLSIKGAVTEHRKSTEPLQGKIFSEDIDSEKILEPEKNLKTRESKEFIESLHLFFGDIALHRQAVLYKKIKMFSHENVGWGKISLPEIQMHTEAVWLTIEENYLIRLIPQSEWGELLYSLSYLLGRLAPAYLMCDSMDIRAISFARSPFTEKPTILFYDTMPGGIALAKRLFHLIFDLAHAAEEIVRQCSCDDGCPSCIGPKGKGHLTNEQESLPKSFKILTQNILQDILIAMPENALEHDLADLTEFSGHKASYP